MTNFNSHGQDLDGKSQIKPTPFDAHEQKTRGTHVPTKANSKEPHAGLGQQYPKAIDHVQKPGAPAGHLEPVIANNAEEEKAYFETNAKKEKSKEEEPA
jgi:hypothetical protein